MAGVEKVLGYFKWLGFGLKEISFFLREGWGGNGLGGKLVLRIN